MSLWYSFCIILVKKESKLDDIVLFCLNPLKLKSIFQFLIDTLLSLYVSDYLMNIVISINSARKGIAPPLHVDLYWHQWQLTTSIDTVLLSIMAIGTLRNETERNGTSYEVPDRELIFKQIKLRNILIRWPIHLS